MSTLPFLFAAQLAFFLAAFRRSTTRPVRWHRLIWIPVALVLWGALSSWFAISGVYDASWLLATLPALWLPFVPLLVLALVFSIPAVRRDLVPLLKAVPAHWLVAIQALRITALGTLIKTIQGQFPLHAELAVGLTDLAFGLSALWLFGRVRSGRVSADALALWHIIGIALIAIPGFVSIQLGMPGPVQLLIDPPTTAVLYDFPMVLAPTLVVPLFLALNAWGIWNALKAPRVSDARASASPAA